MRFRSTLTSIALVAAAVAAPAAATGTAGSKTPERPGTPNPYLSLLPAGQEPDVKGWMAYAAAQGRAADGAPTKLDGGHRATVRVDESEPNDSLGQADVVNGFGTSTNEDNEARVHATLRPFPNAADGTIKPEENGSRPSATSTGLGSEASVTYSSTIGDGAYGGSSGDYDLFAVSANAGEHIVVDVDAAVLGSTLDPVVSIFASSGNALLAANDDDARSLDSFVDYAVTANGTYYVAVSGYVATPDPFLRDPDDPSSGAGAGSTGPYDVTISRTVPDVDFFRFSLDAGDVFGATVATGDANAVFVYGPGNNLLLGSNQDLVAAAYPDQSPLRGGGPHVGLVARDAGQYTVAVTSGSGPYRLDLQAYLPGSEGGFGNDQQIVFLDFDGATIPNADELFFGQPDAQLSPFADFLTDWGLSRSQEDDAIDAIIAVVRENLDADLRGGLNGDRDASGTRGAFDVVIRNSRDHADPGSGRNVTRVVIGGTIEQLGAPTIGIAESIDIGNYDLSELAVVLLDLLSAPNGNPNSLNSIPTGGSATKLDLVAEGVGNIVAHEIGHLLGNWHTENGNANGQIMDQGGDLPNSVGIGGDGIYGTPDDVDIDFGDDQYALVEGFVGRENTDAHTAHALSTGTADVASDTYGSIGIGGTRKVGSTKGLSANDDPGPAGPLRVALNRRPMHGDVTVNPDGSFTYRHDGGAGVSDTFTYTATTTGHPSPATKVTLRVGANETLRLSGDDRIQTANDISQSSYPANGAAYTAFGTASRAKAVVLARSDEFADGLAGTPFAHSVGGPLLLTRPDRLDEAARTELLRLLGGSGKVYVLGGEAAIQPAVVDAIAAEGYAVERIFGDDRFETAAAIAERLGAVDTIIVARSSVFADALAAGPAAIASNGAIVLSADDQPHPATDDYLDTQPKATVYAAGGPAAAAYPGAEPLIGDDRFETAQLVADAFFDDPPTVGIARSDVFADALTGGAHVGRSGGPILLTPTSDLHPVTASYLADNAPAIRVAWIYGGEVAVAATVLDAVAEAIT